MAQEISALPINALVKDTGTLYHGKPIIWSVKDKNHTGYPAGSVTLQTEYILAVKAFDAIEASNSDTNRARYGNNRYSVANMLQWLNSSAAAGGWYSAQHSADAPPTSANVNTYNPYDTEAGFLYGFSENMRNALLTTTVTTALNTVTDGGGSEQVSSKVLLPSTTEVGLANENGIAEGSLLAGYSSDNSSRLAYPTAEAVANSNYTNNNFAVGLPWHWWTRAPYASYSYDVRNVDTTGALARAHAYRGGLGVRPLCNLSSEILVSDSPDSDGAYIIQWNQPPTVPDSITVPDNVRGGETLTVTWGASTDPDGNFSGYILERQYNGGAWAEVYKGINRTHTDTITFGWLTVAYRVKAYDSVGAESDYRTSGTYDVVNNTPPTISGSDGDLGQKTGAFDQAYTITDPDAGQTITVVEKIDSTTKRSFTATSGAENTFAVTADEWTGLTNGSHTLTITASDNFGGTATRTYTFSKSETEIELTLETPLAADDMIEKAIMSVTRQIPAGATFTVEVCNNGFDASPAWEDVTTAVVGNSKFFFANTTKTAENWGFNFRIKVDRNGAEGDCFIVSIGGNFE